MPIKIISMIKITVLAAVLFPAMGAFPKGTGMTTSLPLDLSAMLQPFPESAVYKEADYHVWGAQITKGDDDRYYMVYSRWAKKGGDWLTTSEIALASADRIEGPYQHEKVLLKGSGAGHWNELMAHNPKLKRFEGKYYLYHISSKSGPTRGHIRDSQRIGVAVAGHIQGPYVISESPIIEPGTPAHNITVNPGVTRMQDGRYLMILKGDLKPKQPTDRMGQRVQAMAIADRPEGPFKMLPELALHDIDSEDASLWYDAKRELYYAVYHAHTHLGLLESDDGISWRKAEHNLITSNELERKDGLILKSRRPLQRPNVFVDNGVCRAMTVSLEARGGWFCVVVPLDTAK